MAEKVNYTFNTSSVGDTAGHGVQMSGWTRFSQDATGVNTIVAGNNTNRMSMQTPFGLWATTFKTDILYTDCDFTAFINSPNAYVSARTLIDSTVAPTGFIVQVFPAGGGISINKNCFSASFSVASFSIAPFSNEFKIRITMVGYILTTYINDVLIGSYDFTGSGFFLCGFDGPLQGYPSVTTFNSNVTWDSGDVTPSFVLMP